LRYRGLAFARWHDGAIFFGCNDIREELTPATRGAFERVMQDLGVHRHPLASDTRHPLYRVYRAQAERWLESRVRNDVTRVDGVLDARFVYAQVFAGSGAEHGIIDVLTITRAGRLAILELKASEHIHLSLQAADLLVTGAPPYGAWRVSQLRLFSGRGNSRSAATGLSGCSRLAFPSGDRHFAGSAVTAIEVVRVGLTVSWRRGIRVVMRQWPPNIAARQIFNRYRVRGGRHLKDRRKKRCLHPDPTRMKSHRESSNCRCGDSRWGNGR
jgi:hypothetical protein